MKPCPLHPDETQPCRPEWCGVARVRSALALAPKPDRDPPDTTHARALERARQERANRTETQK